MKKIAVMAIAFLLFIPFASINGNDVASNTSTNNILYVGGSGPNNYTSIQSAINDASNGYTIYVYPGNYNESIVINKSISLIGIEQNGEKPVIDGGGRSFAINISADGCIVKQFKIINYGDSSNWYIGYALRIFSNGNDIENNRIECSATAILMSNASFNIVINNTITNTKGVGIRMEYRANSNLIKQNNVSDNTAFGIWVVRSDNNIITENMIIRSFDGIDLDEGANNTIISHNTILHSSQYGVAIGSSHYGKIIGNNISYNGCDGILITDSSYTEVYDNIVFHNGWDGIELKAPAAYTKYNKIAHNSILYNGLIGVYIWGWCKYNTIEENNIIGNKKYNAHFVIPDRSYNNTWDANYWGNWHIPLPKPIFGLSRIYPWLNFDKHPAMEPYGNSISVVIWQNVNIPQFLPGSKLNNVKHITI